MKWDNLIIILENASINTQTQIKCQLLRK